MVSLSALRSHSLLRAIATLLTGGAVAQMVPLLLGPVLARLFTPDAFGAFTAFATVSATVAVVACARYEFALPLARQDAQARALLVLCVRILALVALVCVPLAWALARWHHLPMPALLPVAVLVAGLLQLLVMWNNRAEAFRALAVSRVLQYGAAALVQAGLGGWLWWQTQRPADASQAWALIVPPTLAAALACIPLWRAAPAQGWRTVWGAVWRTPCAGDAQAMRQVALRYKDFPLLNTPHAFLGVLQDALAVALLIGISGDAAAGFWGLALRYLKAPATLVGSAVSQVLYPRLAAARPDEARRMVRLAMLLLAAVAAPLVLVLLLAGPWLFAWVFGSHWRTAGELAQALAPYIGVHFVAAPLAVVTMVWNAQQWAFKLALVGQVVFVVALGAGLHIGGLLVGAWCVSCGMGLYFLYFFYKLHTWRLDEQAHAAR